MEAEEEGRGRDDPQQPGSEGAVRSGCGGVQAGKVRQHLCVHVRA